MRGGEGGRDDESCNSSAVPPRPCSVPRPAAAPSSEEETRVPLLLLRPRPPQLPLTGPARPDLEHDDIYRARERRFILL